MLIAKLGAENEAQRAQISGLLLEVSALRKDLGRVDEDFEEAKVQKNAALLEFMQILASEEERKRSVASLKHSNAGKWRQLEELHLENARLRAAIQE